MSYLVTETIKRALAECRCNQEPTTIALQLSLKEEEEQEDGGANASPPAKRSKKEEGNEGQNPVADISPDVFLELQEDLTKITKTRKRKTASTTPSSRPGKGRSVVDPRPLAGDCHLRHVEPTWFPLPARRCQDLERLAKEDGQMSYLLRLAFRECSKLNFGEFKRSLGKLLFQRGSDFLSSLYLNLGNKSVSSLSPGQAAMLFPKVLIQRLEGVFVELFGALEEGESYVEVFFNMLGNWRRAHNKYKYLAVRAKQPHHQAFFQQQVEAGASASEDAPPGFDCYRDVNHEVAPPAKDAVKMADLEWFLPVGSEAEEDEEALVEDDDSDAE